MSKRMGRPRQGSDEECEERILAIRSLLYSRGVSAMEASRRLGWHPNTLGVSLSHHDRMSDARYVRIADAIEQIAKERA